MSKINSAHGTSTFKIKNTLLTKIQHIIFIGFQRYLTSIFAKKSIELRILIGRKDIMYKVLFVLENESLNSVKL